MKYVDSKTSTRGASCPPSTLRQDWHHRREALIRQGDARTPVGHLQLQLLDAVLARYGSSQVALQPARFALPEGDLTQRQSLLAAHGLTNVAAAIRTEGQAAARIAGVLERMASKGEVEPTEQSPTERDDESFAPASPHARRLNRCRRGLCGTAEMRLEAIRELAAVGELDDVGLLLDLLSLPAQPDEVPAEREAMIHVLRRICGLFEPRPNVPPPRL